MVDQARAQGRTRGKTSVMFLSGAAFTLLCLWAASVFAQPAQPSEGVAKESAGARQQDEALHRVMALWQSGRHDEAWAQYQEVARVLGGEGVMLDPGKRRHAD